MPSIGLSELLIIAAVIIIFIRPEDLPKFVRTVGKFYTELQRNLLKIRRMGHETLDDITRMDQTPRNSDVTAAEEPPPPTFSLKPAALPVVPSPSTGSETDTALTPEGPLKQSS